MQERPQFTNVILQRCSSQQQTMFSVKIEQNLPPLRLKIFDMLCFIQDHIVPLFSFEHFLVLQSDFIWCDAYLKRVHATPARSFLSTFSSWTIVSENFKGRTPLLELNFPVYYNACWNDYKVRAPNSFLAGHLSQYGDGLDCLAQPHFISQDAVHFLLLEGS